MGIKDGLRALGRALVPVPRYASGGMATTALRGQDVREVLDTEQRIPRAELERRGFGDPPATRFSVIDYSAIDALRAHPAAERLRERMTEIVQQAIAEDRAQRPAYDCEELAIAQQNRHDAAWLAGYRAGIASEKARGRVQLVIDGGYVVIAEDALAKLVGPERLAAMRASGRAIEHTGGREHG